MILAVHKPRGPTSNAVLNIIRRIVGTKKVGHAGTLDPLAEGVLVVGIGREATRTLAKEVAKEKEYLADILIGATSSTDDAEGAITQQVVEQKPSGSQIDVAVRSFEGGYMQTPPIYSALKVKGKESYKLARAGKKVVLEPRRAEIKEIEVLHYKWPMLKLRVVTGPGVYIRALARDIGEKLGMGAYLAGLVRTRVGEFTLEQAVRMEDLERYINAQ